MRKAVIHLTIGLLAVVVGLAFIIQSPARRAEAGTDSYVSTWNATHYLVAKRKLPNNAFDEIAIGVASWEVKGSVSSGGPYFTVFYFKETWTAPEEYPAFKGGDNLPLIEWNRTSNINKLWLVGYVGRNEDRNRIEITKKGVADPLQKTGGNAAKVDGKTASCIRDSDCFFTTGAYGFTDIVDWHKTTNNKNLSAGILIPIQWTVTGTICELDTEPECQ